MDWKDIDDLARRTVVNMANRLSREDEGQERENEDKIVRELTTPRVFEEEIRRRGKYDGNKVFRQVQAKRRRRVIGRICAVACSLLLVMCGVWLFWGESRQVAEQMPIVYGVRGNQQVILQLSGGERVTLGGKDTMRLREKDKAIEVKGGVIAYTPEEGETSDKRENLYNTLFVPRGGEFRVELSDGSVVHLNADSELRYPLAFAGNERRVYLKGEAWFEVAKNKDVPFYVVADSIQVRVYGTSFNVNTHGMKVVQTVLVEGSIGIQALASSREVRVQPGQLAEYNRTDGEILVREVDVRQYTAWREGVFYFNDKTLEDIMGELSRWYGMEVVYLSDRGKELHFSGFLKRYEDVRKILATVTESTGIKFDIVKNRIIVN